MLGVADSLYRLRLYRLARVQGYRKCLLAAGIQPQVVGDERGATNMEEGKEGVLGNLCQFISTCESEMTIVAMVG